MTGAIHICRGVNRRYAALTKPAGCRKWRTISGGHKTLEIAAVKLARYMARQRRGGRGIVCLTADYYDPLPVLRIERP